MLSLWTDFIQSVENLNRRQRLILLFVKGNSSCLMAFKLRPQVFPASRLIVKHNWLFLSLRSAGIKTETMSLARLGLQLPDCRSWDLSVSITSCTNFMSLYSVGSAFLENPNTQLLHAVLTYWLVRQWAPPAFMNLLLESPFLGEVCV